MIIIGISLKLTLFNYYVRQTSRFRKENRSRNRWHPFGALGIHKFILGYTKEGVIMLLVTVLTFGILGMVMSIIGIVEGIIYLTKTDEDFVATYINGKKGWF